MQLFNVTGSGSTMVINTGGGSDGTTFRWDPVATSRGFPRQVVSALISRCPVRNLSVFGGVGAAPASRCPVKRILWASHTFIFRLGLTEGPFRVGTLRRCAATCRAPHGAALRALVTAFNVSLAMHLEMGSVGKPCGGGTIVDQAYVSQYICNIKPSFP